MQSQYIQICLLSCVWLKSSPFPGSLGPPRSAQVKRIMARESIWWQICRQSIILNHRFGLDNRRFGLDNWGRWASLVCNSTSTWRDYLRKGMLLNFTTVVSQNLQKSTKQRYCTYQYYDYLRKGMLNVQQQLLQNIQKVWNRNLCVLSVPWLSEDEDAQLTRKQKVLNSCVANFPKKTQTQTSTEIHLFPNRKGEGSKPVLGGYNLPTMKMLI